MTVEKIDEENVHIKNDSEETADNKDKEISGQAIGLTLEPDPPQKMSINIKDLQDKTKFLARVNEKGLINENTGSSISIRENGQINLSSGLCCQYKMNPNGRTNELSLESKVTTNRRIIDSDDIVINNHKLNPDLWELTDFKEVSLPYTEKAVIGDMTLQAHILVKAWEPNLKRYMLIRRPMRVRMFSPKLNMPDINTGLGINDPLKVDEDILALTTKGYQVNAVISDAKSLIGKAGVNRDATFSLEDTMDGTGSLSGSSYSDYTAIASGENATVIWKFLKGKGITDEAAAGIMGNLTCESGLDPTKVEGGSHADSPTHGVGFGLAQWTYYSRQDNLCALAQAKGKKPSDMGVQLNFLWQELNNSYSSLIPIMKDTSKTVLEQTISFHDGYEGSADSLEKVKNNRGTAAQTFYDKFHGTK